MRLISCHDGRLLSLDAEELGAGSAGPSTAGDRGFITGLPALDALPPGGAFARGAVHEILAEVGQGTPFFLAMLLARCSEGGGGVEGLGGGVKTNLHFLTPPSNPSTPPPHPSPPPRRSVIWCDPRGEIYPPALAAHGIVLEQLFLLHPRAATDQTWAVAECLRCRGVGAVVAAVDYRLSRVEARRLQLSAERGGGAGILLRPANRPVSSEHAAVTRWLVRPVPGERTVQRWSVQLIHGHGGRVGQAVILEYSRETNRVRAVAAVVDRRVTPSPRTAAG